MVLELQVAEQKPSVVKNLEAGQDKQLGALRLQSMQTVSAVQSITVPKKWFSSTFEITILVCPVEVSITLSIVKLR